MKLLHIADLHLGKRVNQFRMLPDQQYILEQVLHCIDSAPVDGVLIAGDVYDKAVPSAEAVQVFDRFLTSLVERNLWVFVISGNHDSAERLSFGAAIMEKKHVYIAPVFAGQLKSITMNDEYGPVNVYLLPFVKPAQVSVFYPEQSIETYEEAIKVILSHTEINTEERNVLVVHQFVSAVGTVLEECDSEYNSIGGLDKVDFSVFDGFDYVALGHLHGPQKVGRDTIQYAGSPLKYSFSEIFQKKGMTAVALKEKGLVETERIFLKPRHEMRRIQGPIEELLSPEIYTQGDREDYLHVVLTDKEEILDAIGKVRRIYPNVMQLDFEKELIGGELRELSEVAARPEIPKLFKDFYTEQNQKEPTKEQIDYVLACLDNLGGEWL